MKTSAIRKLRNKLAADQPVYGLWITLESPSIAEMAVALGLDWIVIDAEHGHLGLEGDHRAYSRRRAQRHGGAGARGGVEHWADQAGAGHRRRRRRRPLGGIGGAVAAGGRLCPLSAGGRARHRGRTGDLLGPVLRRTCRGGQRTRARRADHRIGQRRPQHPLDAQRGRRGNLSSSARPTIPLRPVTAASGKARAWRRKSSRSKTRSAPPANTAAWLPRATRIWRSGASKDSACLGLGLDGGLLLRSLHGALAAVGRDRRIVASFQPESEPPPAVPLDRPPESMRPDRGEVITAVGQGPKMRSAAAWSSSAWWASSTGRET